MYNLLFLLLVFVPAFDMAIPGLNYWDEAFAVIAPVAGMVKLYRQGKGRLPLTSLVKKGILLLVAILAIGVMGNLLHPNFQSNVTAIVKDAVALVKLPLVAIFLLQGRETPKRERIIHDAAKMSRWIVLFTAAIAVVGYVVDIGVYTSEVRILKCFKFIFSHPTFMVSSYVMILAVLMADSMTKNRLYILLDCFIIFMGQRTKGYLAIAMALCLLFISEKWVKALFKTIKGKLKIKTKYILLLALVLLAGGWIIGRSKITEYMGWGLTAARPALYIVGLMIASSMFPFGSGLGSFASWLSGQYYSGVYEFYNISLVNGLRPEAYNYIADVFWPYIYGQFGFIGLFLYVWLLWIIIKYQFTALRSYDKIAAFAVLWGYALFASTAEAYFTNATGVQMAVVLALFVGRDLCRPNRPQADAESKETL